MAETNTIAPTLDMIRQHRHEILQLAEQHGASNVRVFGSVARGDATSKSDVDIVAVFEAHTLTDRVALIQALSDLLGYPVDVVSEKALRPHLKVNALNDSVRI